MWEENERESARPRVLHDWFLAMMFFKCGGGKEAVVKEKCKLQERILKRQAWGTI